MSKRLFGVLLCVFLALASLIINGGDDTGTWMAAAMVITFCTPSRPQDHEG